MHDVRDGDNPARFGLRRHSFLQAGTVFEMQLRLDQAVSRWEAYWTARALVEGQHTVRGLRSI